MKNHDKDMESSYLEYLDANDLYGWAMSQKRPVNGFEWVEGLYQFKEDFIKNYDEDSNKGYFLEVDVKCPKHLLGLHSDLSFYLKGITLKNVISLFVTFITRKTMLFT